MIRITHAMLLLIRVWLIYKLPIKDLRFNMPHKAGTTSRVNLANCLKFAGGDQSGHRCS